MCFTETQSYINFLTLIGVSIFVYPDYRLSIPLIFLGLKDLIQALSYKNIRNYKSTQFLTSLSWIHICLQPLFVNIFISHFDKKFRHWDKVFFLCIIYGLYYITMLNEFDIQNDPDCTKLHKKDDLCSENTMSYIGKYHLGYKFSSDKDIIIEPMNNIPIRLSRIIYVILTFIPSLFTKSINIGILWGLFTLLIAIIFNNAGSADGEVAAIWCFSSIAIAIPLALYGKHKF
jgi:hypothetical protein|tara:strand:+ start:3355 stop:4047 length:693 start_codon:yes stop_codon:yes gene_type:complete